jgi:hypothetical protein
VEALQANYRYVRSLRATNEDEAFEVCRRQQGQHLVIPTIVHWEDRAMQWSGKPDHVKVQLVLREVDDDTATRMVIFEGKQGHGLHFTDSPAEDLLTEKFNEAVWRLLPGNPSSP